MSALLLAAVLTAPTAQAGTLTFTNGRSQVRLSSAQLASTGYCLGFRRSRRP
jgi:hypothetical protein